MMLRREAIPAVYEDGLLRPLKPLLLPNHQQVEIIILSEQSSIQPNADRQRHLHDAVNSWNTQQLYSTVREPKPLGRTEQTQLDEEFDQILAEIHRHSQYDSEESLTDLVDEAVNAVRTTY